MFDVPQLKQTALGAQIAHELRFRIVSGQLTTGEHLVELRLSEGFGVSRGPVRDALRQLEAEGLVETRRKGVYVVGLQDKDIEELYSLRESLESLAVKLTLEQTGIDWSVFERSIDAMRDAADRNTAREFAVADLAFHALFYELSGHRRLASVWKQLQPTFTVLLEVTTAQDVDLNPSAESHAEILRCVQTGNVDAAMTELSQHLLGAKNRLTKAHGQLRHDLRTKKA